MHMMATPMAVSMGAAMAPMTRRKIQARTKIMGSAMLTCKIMKILQHFYN